VIMYAQKESSETGKILAANERSRKDIVIHVTGGFKYENR